jgi:chromosomal replication initiation ATPase DnaA
MYSNTNSNKLLCLFGRSGSGKTRLMHSMINELSVTDSPGKALLTGAELLGEEILAAMRLNEIEAFRGKYLGLENLYIDNLWVLGKRPALAGELNQLIQARRNAGRMTVLASEFSLEEWRSKNPVLAVLLASGKAVDL